MRVVKYPFFKTYPFQCRGMADSALEHSSRVSRICVRLYFLDELVALSFRYLGATRGDGQGNRALSVTA